MMNFQKYLLEKSDEKISKNEKEQNVRVKIIKRFNTDKEVTLKELEKFAKENEMSLEDLYKEIFKIFNQFLYRRYEDINVNPKELSKGIEHEKEHTKDEEIAKIIALDHLKQIPNYYTLLNKFDKD